MNDEDIVYSPASITNPGVVHTDRDCPRLQRANQVLEHPAEAYPENTDTCEWCAGDEEIIADDGPSGPWEDLEAMDPDDLVTDGGQPAEESTGEDRDLPWCGCASGQPSLALDEDEIGPARVQVLWCDRCASVLTTVVEVPEDD